MRAKPDVSTTAGRAVLRALQAQANGPDAQVNILSGAAPLAQSYAECAAIAIQVLPEALDRLDKLEALVGDLLREGDWMGDCKMCGLNQSREWRALKSMVDESAT